MTNNDSSHSTNGAAKRIVGITSCPTGIAHTFMAAEALNAGAKSLGYEVKIETQGSVGAQNTLTDEDIANADVVIIAADTNVRLDRFEGKKLYSTSTKAAINNAVDVVKTALNEGSIHGEGASTSNTSKRNDKKVALPGIYKYLMSGVSHMIPFVVTGGLLIAISLALGGEPTAQGLAIPPDSFWNKILDVGVVAFQLMIPILAGYIAYSIGDRAALAPGFIGGWIANTGSFYDAPAGTGFIGAIVAGLLVGYFIKWMMSFNYHKLIQPLLPIIIAPILGTLFIAFIFIFVIGAPIASLMAGMTEILTNMSSGNIILLGVVLGGLAGFDMGGPFNKVAFLFSVGMIASGQTQFMGAMACAIPVAPLGMGIATLIGKKFELFEEEELEAGKAAGAMGLVGISEGAIPFAAKDPLSVIPANVIGSMVAAVLAFSLGITDSVAHGGPVVVLLGAVNKPVLALGCMLAGALVTAFVCVAIKKARQMKLTAV